MSLHSGKLEMFLVFDRLDRSEHLEQVLCAGYRLKDVRGERWTAFVNRAKAGNTAAVACAVDVMKVAIATIEFPETPVLVVPVLGSADTTARPNAAMSRMATGICELKGYVDGQRLLRKKAHASLHKLRGATSRDNEVDNKYTSRRFEILGVTNVGCVLLVDDLVTRGTTMNDAARAIRSANGEIGVFGVALGKSESRSWAGAGANNDHLSKAVLRAAGLA